ncbi:MAG: hypothetical protein AAGD14_16535, partial [Planctomycetota bacterium]
LLQLAWPGAEDFEPLVQAAATGLGNGLELFFERLWTGLWVFFWVFLWAILALIPLSILVHRLVRPRR